MQEINRQGRLNEACVADFAARQQFDEVITAIALFASAPIHMIADLMRNLRVDGLIVACKAAGLKWATVNLILTNRFAHHTVAKEEMDEARKTFLALSQQTAQRTLRFWQTRESARHAG